MVHDFTSPRAISSAKGNFHPCLKNGSQPPTDNEKRSLGTLENAADREINPKVTSYVIMLARWTTTFGSSAGAAAHCEA